METFGKWLLRHRKALGLTQGDVAKRARVSVSYVSTLERGQPHSTTGEEIRPDREKVEALAKSVKGSIGEALVLAGYTSKQTLPAFFYSFNFNILTPEDLRDIETFIRFKFHSYGIPNAEYVGRPPIDKKELLINGGKDELVDNYGKKTIEEAEAEVEKWEHGDKKAA